MKKLSETRKPAGEWVGWGKDGKRCVGHLGEIITTEYECPCGKGKVITTFENIPGYRESHAHVVCDVCEKLYDADYNWARPDEEILQPRKT